MIDDKYVIFIMFYKIVKKGFCSKFIIIINIIYYWVQFFEIYFSKYE